MKPKTMVLILLAVTCGLGASFMTSRLLSERQSEEEKIEVLVAKKNLDTGLIIKKPEDLFETKVKAKDDVPKNAILELAQLKGRQLRIPRRAGDIITQDELLDKESPGVAGHLPEGFRAIGTRVNMESTAGGFASLPLSRVDIIQSVRRGGDKDSFSQILLENVLVLAVDTTTQRDETGKAMPGGVVTLALSPEDALKLTLARDMGALSLVLRPFGETKKTSTPKVTGDQVINNRTAAHGKPSDEESDAFAARNAAKNSVAGFGDIPANLPQQAPVFEKKERPFRMVIVNGKQRQNINFFQEEDGTWAERAETPATPEATEEEPAVRQQPAAGKK